MGRKTRIGLVILLILLVLGGAALWWLRGNLDGLVRRAIQHYGGEMAQAEVSLRAVHIDLANGRGELQGLRIGNPAGFQSAYALQVEHIVLQLDLTTLTAPVVHIESIEVLAPDLIYEKAGGRTNFEVLQGNITRRLNEGAGKPVGPAKPPRRYLVDHFALRKAHAQAQAPFLSGATVNVNLPDLQLQQLGQGQGGLTAEELGQVITRSIERQLKVSINFDKLLKSATTGLHKATDAVKGLFKK